MKLNNVQIAGLLLLIIGLFSTVLFSGLDLKMIPALLIGFGAGLTVYKKKRE